MNLIDGTIYKYYCLDEKITDFYIGSTTDFNRRRIEHRANVKCEKITRKNKLKVYEFIKSNGGKNNWAFEILNKGKFVSKEEMHKQEGLFIKELKPSLNCHIPTRTAREYYLDNRDDILKKKKERYHKLKNTTILCDTCFKLLTEVYSKSHIEKCDKNYEI